MFKILHGKVATEVSINMSYDHSVEEMAKMWRELLELILIPEADEESVKIVLTVLTFNWKVFYKAHCFFSVSLNMSDAFSHGTLL